MLVARFTTLAPAKLYSIRSKNYEVIMRSSIIFTTALFGSLTVLAQTPGELAAQIPQCAVRSPNPM